MFNFFAHTEILDEPGAPEGVEVIEIPDDRRSGGSCVLTLQLNYPSDIGPDEIPHLIYHIDYQSRREVITATSYTFIVQNCTRELRINVTTVNRCGSMGGSVVNIVPTFLPVSRGATEAPNHASSAGKSGRRVLSPSQITHSK